MQQIKPLERGPVAGWVGGVGGGGGCHRNVSALPSGSIHMVTLKYYNSKFIFRVTVAL